MKEVRKTTQLKKDFKRFKNNKPFVATLLSLVRLLADGHEIPEQYDPHSLKGDWAGFMECHVENDSLLIWLDKNCNVVELVRNRLTFRTVWKRPKK